MIDHFGKLESFDAEQRGVEDVKQKQKQNGVFQLTKLQNGKKTRSNQTNDQELNLKGILLNMPSKEQNPKAKIADCAQQNDEHTLIQNFVSLFHNHFSLPGYATSRESVSVAFSGRPAVLHRKLRMTTI
jgi:hypothetical protein